MRICRHVPPPDRDGVALGVIVTERIAVVGGGIAGASAAYFLVEAAPDSEVVLLEAEEHLAMHTTGRSAALLLETGCGFCGTPPGTRTRNLRIKSPMLCQLS